MRALRSCVALSVLVAVSGCSLLVDHDGPYQRNLGRDGGPGDGGPSGQDASTPVPTAPAVRITPEHPVTSDDLRLEITMESVDPLDAGPVQYRFQWSRGSDPTSNTTDTVSAEETAKGEMWRVSVTPVSADGREGESASASVTIGNLPPRLPSAGLSHYRPIEGERLEVLTAGLVDPDGEAARLVCTWFVDGAPIEGLTDDQVVLDERFPVGSHVKVRVTPRDDTEDGEPIETGEAIVVANTVRWRQLEPDRRLSMQGFASKGDVVFDPLHQRVLTIQYSESGVALWEYALLPTGGRWIELHPSGTAPSLLDPSIVLDEANQRLLFVGLSPSADGLASGSLAVIALDLSVRGGEVWQPITPSGDAPLGGVLAAVGIDAERNRLLVYGGITFDPDAMGAMNELVTLDLTPGLEAWERVDIPEPRPPAFGGAIIVDASRDRALLVGGAVSEDGGVLNEARASDAIYALDLNALSEGFSSSGTLLPLPLFGAATMVDASHDRALVAWGGTSTVDDAVMSAAVWSMDLETLEVTELTTTDAPLAGGMHGFLAEDVYEPGRVIANTGTTDFFGSAVNLYALDLENLSFTPLDAIGVTSPPAVGDAFASADAAGLLLFGGKNATETDQVWRYGARGWSPIDALPDDATGRSPGARSGGGSIPTFDSSMWVFGGHAADADVESTVWTLTPSSGGEAQWTERPVPASDSVPEPTGGPSLFDVSCAAEGFGLFRGDGSHDVWLFQCNTGGCSWDPLSFSGAQPSSRSGAVTSAVGSEVVLFGGARLNDVWLLEPCLPVPAWTAITPSGTPPAGRSYHRMVLVPSSSSDVTRWLVHGGLGTETYGDAFMLSREAGAYRWEPLNADGDPPSARYRHAMVWDAARSRVLIYGGSSGSLFTEYKADLWELRFPAAR